MRKTGNELKSELLDSKSKLQDSEHFTWHEPGGPQNVGESKPEDIIDIENQAEESSGVVVSEPDSVTKKADAEGHEFEGETEETPPKSSQ